MIDTKQFNTDVQQAIIYRLKKTGAEIDSTIIRDLIADHGTERLRIQDHYNRYTVDEATVPIFAKEPPIGAFQKINNQLNHDYPGLLVRTKAGYFAGTPPTLAYRRGEKSESAAKKDSGFINDWLLEISFDELVNESALLAGNLGYAIWFLYINTEGKTRMINVPPWEAILVLDRTTGETQMALRYYTIVISDAEGNSVERTRVEWWTDKGASFWIGTGDGEYTQEDSEVRYDPATGETDSMSEILHPFGKVPFVICENNSQHMSDYDAILNLVDGQDQVKSSLCNDIEQIASSLLKYKNMKVTQENIDALQWSGGLEVGEDQDVSFLVKQIVCDPHIEFMTKNDEHIHKISGIPDLTSEQFGNAPVISIKIKLFALESLSTIAENKMKKALRLVFNMLAKVWALAGIKIEPIDVQFEFQRKFPENLKEETETQASMKGLVSEKTRLTNYSIVDDPEAEIEQMQNETDEIPDLDEIPPEEPEEEEEEEKIEVGG